MKGINEKKIKEMGKKYNLARQLADKYLFDTEYVISIVDIFFSKGVLSNVDKSNSKIWNDELECYTPYYAMFIWREVTIPTIGIDYESYQAIGSEKVYTCRLQKSGSWGSFNQKTYTYEELKKRREDERQESQYR